MKPVAPLMIVLAVLAVGLACDSSLTDPRQPFGPHLRPVPKDVGIEPVPCSDLPYDSVTQVIGPSGGYLSIGPHALRIPKGALGKSTVSITAVLPTGTGTNAVQFEPEGLRFMSAVYLRMSYTNCQQSQRSKQVVYVDDGKIVEKRPSADDPLTQTVTGELSHFSNYAVAW